MYHDSDKVKPLVAAVRGLGYRVYMGKLDEIATSRIKTWILSGADRDVTDTDAVQVPLELLTLNKRFLMICYSMESVLYQMGYPIQKRANEKGYFRLRLDRTITAYRNHQYFFRPNDLPILAAYHGELMMTIIGPALLVQFHPEHSSDGRHLLSQFLKNTPAN
jgi:GMP synthase-like glutamine amidotransferase